MKYSLSEKYNLPEFQKRIMGPNPIKLTEELMADSKTLSGAVVCDLGSGMGATSVFLCKEYGYVVYAADLWSEPEENRAFFREQGINDECLIPVKADAEALPFDREFFDAVVCVDSYNYFGRDRAYLDNKLLPFVKSGGYVYIAVTGMKKDCHNDIPPELLLSWTPEQLDYIHDMSYWNSIVSKSRAAEIVYMGEMNCAEEAWEDWLKQDNDYARGDLKSMRAGGGKYLNFIKIVLRKK